MPRRFVHLDSLKEEIRGWFFDELLDSAAIANRVSLRLDQSCTPRTIERRLQAWGFHKRNRIQETSELRLRIAVLFQMSYTDRNIVRQL
jgi:hypothetical protein